MTPTIYRIEFPDGQTYIGATVHFSVRRRTHLRHARKGKSVSTALQAAFNAHPVCGIYEIASGFSREDLHVLERQVIAQEQPTLNSNTRPTPLPARYSGANKAWGPFQCVRDAAEALGLSYQATKHAARRYTYEEYQERQRAIRNQQFFGPPDPRNNKKTIRLESGWFWRADVCKVSARTASDRRDRGWSHEASHTTPPGAQNPEVAPPPANAAQVCRRYGVNPPLYYVRRSIGWTVYEALGLHRRPQPRKPKVRKRVITAGGQTMTLDAWAKKLGVSSGAIHGRLALGWTEAEAVGVEVRAVEIERDKRKAEAEARKRPREQYTHKGFTGTLGAICKHFGYSYPMVYDRRSAGRPFERWFEPKRAPTPPRPQRPPPQWATENYKVLDALADQAPNTHQLTR